MALRELLAKVVFNIDSTKLASSMKMLDATKRGAVELSAAANRPISPKIDDSPFRRLMTTAGDTAKAFVAWGQKSGVVAEQVRNDFEQVSASSQKLRGAGNLDEFSAGIDEASQHALRLRQEIAQLSAVDPSNERIVELKGALLGVREAARHASEQLGEIEDPSIAEATQELIGLRVAVQGVDGALSPDKVTQYSAAFAQAQQKAEQTRQAIDRLKLVDPKNPQIDVLAKQLNTVETEARETATALERVGVATQKAQAPTAGLTSSLGGLQGAFGALGIAFGVTQIVGWFNATLDAADATGKLAKTIGFTTDQTQVWIAFTQQAGGNTESLTGSVKTLARTLDQAAKGSKGMVDAFGELGFEGDKLKELAEGDLSNALLEVGGAIGSVTDEGKRLAIAQQVLGETSLKMLPGFQGGTEAARKQLLALEELAIVYDEDFIGSVEAANDEMHLLGLQFQGIWAQGVNAVMPMLRAIVRSFTSASKAVKELARETMIFQALLPALGIAGFGAIARRVGALLTRFGGLQRILGVVFRALMRFAIPLLIFDDLLTFLQGGDSAIGRLLDKLFGAGTAKKVVEELHAKWQEFIEWFDEAAPELGDTLKKMGGSVASAFGLMWAAVAGNEDDLAAAEARFLESTQWMEAVADDLAFFFDDIWTGIKDSAIEQFDALAFWVDGWVDKILAKIKELSGALADAVTSLPGVGSLFGDEDGATGGESGERKKPPDPGQVAANAARISDRIDGLQSRSPVSNSVSSSTTNNQSVSYVDQSQFTANISAPQSASPSQIADRVDRAAKQRSSDARRTARNVVGATGVR